MTSVEVVVSEGQKADWRTFVEETDAGRKYDTVSDLVRTAVEKQIARDLGDEGVPEEIEDMFLDIQTEFEDLQTKLSLANSHLEDIQQTQIDEATLEDVVDTYTGMIRRDIDEMTGKDQDEDGDR